MTEFEPYGDDPFYLAEKVVFECVPGTPSSYVKGFTMAGHHNCRFIYGDFVGETGHIPRMTLMYYIGDDEKVTVPEGVQVIAGYAFSSYYYHSDYTNHTMKTVSLPSTLLGFNTEAFKNCEALESITIPEQVTEIPDWCFYNCVKLKDLNMHSGVTYLGYQSLYNAGDEVEGTFYYRFPDHMTTCLFDSRYCKAIPIVSKASETALLLSYDNDFRLPYTPFTCENELDYRYLYKKVTINGQEQDKLYLVSYSGGAVADIPSGIYAINASVFKNNTSLTTAIIPEETEIIGDSAFSGCTSLSTVNIPSTMKVLKNRAFENCGTASGDRFYYVLPNGITEMRADSDNDDSFKGCSAVLIATEGSSTCQLLKPRYVHYHTIENAIAGNGVIGNGYAHCPDSYIPLTSSGYYKGNW